MNWGADYQLISTDGKRTTLEAVYSIKTDDGTYIHVRNQGILYSGKDSTGNNTFYFKAAPKFEAPSDSKYAWLNNAIYICSPSFGTPGTITLDVWIVKWCSKLFQAYFFTVTLSSEALQILKKHNNCLYNNVEKKLLSTFAARKGLRNGEGMQKALHSLLFWNKKNTE